jgi:hypothetical protein
MKCVVFAVLLVASPVALADEIACGPVEPGVIAVDGLLDDWRGVPTTEVGHATLRCNTDGKSLFIAVDVTDGYFVRTPKAGPGEDHLSLKIGKQSIGIWPGDSAKAKLKTVGAPKGAKIATALQERGWAVELAVPAGNQPLLPASLSVYDGNSRAKPKIEKTSTWSGSLAFAAAAGLSNAFLESVKLSQADVWREAPFRLGGGASARLVVAGKFAAAITDGFVYIELPVQSRADIRDLRVIDPAGDGRDALAVRYFERGARPDTGREVVGLWRFNSEGVQRVFAVEVAKIDGQRRIDGKVTFVKRGKATDLVVEAGKATPGVDAGSWHETPAEDMIPILLPWGADKKATFQFRGDEYTKK